MRYRSHNEAAFTLVELLVSMSVLALIIVLVAQLMSSATGAITNSRKHMDADTQARLIFDRLAFDFSCMVIRQDVDFHMVKNGSSGSSANDELAFYGEGTGYYSSAGAATPSRSERSPTSIVGYRVKSDTFDSKPRCQLERISKGLGWEPNGTGGSKWQDMAYLPITLVSGTTSRWPNLFSTTAPDPDFQLISEQVFRFEYTYTLTDGTFSLKPILNAPGVQNSLTQSSAPGRTQDQSMGYSVGSRWFDTTANKGYICLDSRTGAAIWGSIGVKDVGAIVIAIAILDPTSRVIVNDYATLTKSFPDAAGTTDIAASWMSVVNSPNFAQSAGIPQQAASAVRVYQRAFPFPRQP